MSNYKQIRVLHVLRALDLGGVETRTMEIYRELDRVKIQFDFLTMDGGDHPYNKEVKELGGRIFVINNPKDVTPFKHFWEMYSIMKNNKDIQVVHDHTAFHGGMVLLAARLARKKIRISHSRSAADWRENTFKRRIYLKVMRMFILTQSTLLIGCGREAAEFLFGKNVINSKKYLFLPNAIANEKLYPKVNENDKNINNIKSKLNISNDEFIIGHIGRLSPEKNHLKLLKIAIRLKERGLKFKMLLIGDGIERDNIEDYITENNLSNNIILLGFQKDIVDFLNFIDVIVMPSKFEGLPGSIIEAQANQVPCVLSNNITKEVDLNFNMTEFVSLSASEDEWIEIILSMINIQIPDKQVIINTIKEKHYDIESSVNLLSNVYLDQK